MNKKEHINKLIEESINSTDNIKRAAPMPFLLTRINERINKSRENTWEKAARFIGRPAIAIPGLAMLIFINIMVIVLNKPDPFTAVIEQTVQGDDFSYTVTTIDDIENTEP